MATGAGLEAVPAARTIAPVAHRAAREGEIVKRTIRKEPRQTWVVDYSAARARAIEWLGDRYLLARPINATEGAWRKAARTLLDAAPAAAGSTKRTW